jgi:photosystem II stability/assembly factor-like uncharacterized protein
MKKLLLLGLPALLAIALAAATLHYFSHKSPEKRKQAPSQAGAAFLYWGMARTFPDGKFYTEKYTEALAQMRLSAQLRGDRSPEWEALGPDNIGGRTLCMAVNPLDTNILWLGSASGGIWKSTTAGRGATAWQRVETGFPVLGVSAIALNPSNPDIVYAGTGEVYNLENSAPNVAIRVTRGTYGIGILKSTDGGATWSKSLDWSYGQLRGVQDIKINPLRPATVLAATTEGLLRSWDAGATWHTIHNKRMAVDIEIDPADTSRIFVTHGSLDDQDVSGIYRSVNGGTSFLKLTGGLPSTFSGKTLLTICPTQTSVLYASIGEAFAQNGLFKSINGGNSWTKVSTEDVSKYQGWYSHDVAVHPNDPNTFVWVGIDAWKSTNSGAVVDQKTYWYNWNFGYVPAGSSEGPPDYVHADIHRAYYVPGDENKVYVVTDGGLFVSYDGGESWEGRNGGYQTQQFYANLGSSTINPTLAVGGMQDNSTAVYYGDPSWTRVLGGDGECAAVNPLDDQIMYGSSQYLNMYKSIDGGQSWYGIGNEISGNAAFNGPFEISASNPDIMYAGTESLWRSDDGGESWSPVTDFIADGDAILTIAISPENPELVYCSTAPTVTDEARVYKIDVANQTATQMTGLPNRVCMDITYYPGDETRVFAVFAGFNTEHVWQSVDGGNTWHSIDNGLPDVPTNSIIIDPNTANFYIANDLGVWYSSSAGEVWDYYSAEAPQAMLAMHLSIAPDFKLRVATYGLGVWQTDLAEPSKTTEPIAALNIRALRPNPASERTVLDFSLSKEEKITLKVVDINGKTVWKNAAERFPAGEHSRSIPVGDLPAGTYGVVLETAKGRVGRMLVVGR